MKEDDANRNESSSGTSQPKSGDTTQVTQPGTSSGDAKNSSAEGDAKASTLTEEERQKHWNKQKKSNV